jgi:hypothetical protein
MNIYEENGKKEQFGNLRVSERMRAFLKTVMNLQFQRKQKCLYQLSKYNFSRKIQLRN